LVIAAWRSTLWNRQHRVWARKPSVY